MIRNKNNRKNESKFLYLIIVIIVFSLAFILLINKQDKDTYLADIGGTNFSVRPQAGSVIVARDTYAIYPRYYVVYVGNDGYSIYVYNYYDTVSQYNLEYNRLINKIVDYNVKDKMIRYLDSRGYGTYDVIRNNLKIILGNENIQIY